MNISFKSMLICLLAGMFVVTLGALLKIMHLPLVSIVLAGGMVVEVLALAAILWKVFTKKATFN